jgi:hypothetical protein
MGHVLEGYNKESMVLLAPSNKTKSYNLEPIGYAIYFNWLHTGTQIFKRIGGYKL